jgi:hypothetical protein
VSPSSGQYSCICRKCCPMGGNTCRCRDIAMCPGSRRSLLLKNMASQSRQLSCHWDSLRRSVLPKIYNMSQRTASLGRSLCRKSNNSSSAQPCECSRHPVRPPLESLAQPCRRRRASFDPGSQWRSQYLRPWWWMISGNVRGESIAKGSLETRVGDGDR